jgi:hypothetical protein
MEEEKNKYKIEIKVEIDLPKKNDLEGKLNKNGAMEAITEIKVENTKIAEAKLEKEYISIPSLDTFKEDKKYKEKRSILKLNENKSIKN